MPVAVLLLAAAVLFSFWNDNHALRLAPSANGRKPVLYDETDLDSRFSAY